ncbi:MAG: hypothetical protein AB9869_07645 [Verrucomicrobiia bacterium]
MKTYRSVPLFEICCFVSLGLLLAACSHNSTQTGAVNPVGIYALVSADGKQVPATVSHDGHSLELRSGTFSINADGTCSTKTVFCPAPGKEVSREVNATYTQKGSTLTMRWQNAGMTKGTVHGDTFTMNNEGMILVYKK